MPASLLLYCLISWFGIAVCLGGGLLLLWKSRGNRARRILGFILLMWGCAYVLQLALFLSGRMQSYYSFSVEVLIVGNLYVIVTMLYPFEVIRPGWLTLRNAARLLAPYAGIVTLYFLVLLLRGETIRPLASPADLLLHLGEFNVWYRIVLYLTVIGYIICAMAAVFDYEPRYRRFLEDNYASDKNMNVAWLRYFGGGFVLIAAAYILILIDWNPVSHTIHKVIAVLFFLFITCKALLQRDPYAGGQQMEGTRAADDDGAIDTAFMERKKRIDRWLAEAKPYLHADLDLQEASRILSIPAEELARMFNRGFGKPFGAEIARLRVRYAKNLLLADPSLPDRIVAARSGFGDARRFRRAFLRQEGVHPRQFRREHRPEPQPEKRTYP